MNASDIVISKKEFERGGALAAEIGFAPGHESGDAPNTYQASYLLS
jgi:hypothetical protein